jgi:hypothetical protein
MKSKTIIIYFLIILYLLQGAIIGFISAIPLYLDSRGAKWREQGTFNFVFYPFSLKLAWAPIIDAIYITRFGRRKTWLIPIQYVIGITLFILSFYLTTLIEQLRINMLTCIFFFVYFLLACQDICVDGWALTLLTDYNLQWASTCQTVGQTIVGLLMKEKQEDNHLNLKQTYFSIFKLFQKKCLRQLAFLFLISPIGYAATYAMTNLVLKK